MRRVAAYAALIAFALAACTPVEATVEPVTLRVVMADDWATAPVMGDVIDTFERDRPGVRVQLQAVPFSQIPDVVSSAVDLGQPPDVAQWHAFAAAAAGLATPLDEQWARRGLEPADYLPGALDHVTWGGRRYGIPLDTNALVLLSNVDHLTSAGLRPNDLTDLATFQEATGRLVTDSPADHAITVSASSWAVYGWIVAHGGRLLEGPPDDDPVFTFDDPATVAALEFLVQLVRSERSPPPFAPDLSLDAVSSFAAGSVALHATGSWDLPVTRRAADGRRPEVQVLPLPHTDPGGRGPRTVMGGSSLFVPRGAANPDLALDFMLAVTEDEVARRLVVEEGRLPARSRAFDDELFRGSPELAAFVAQLDTAEIMPLIAYPALAAAFRDALEEVLTLRTEPADAMARLQELADRGPALVPPDQR